MPHFFATDLAGLALAFLLGIPIFLLPGYALGYWLDLLRFREQAAATRWWLALLFGISLVPILLYLSELLLGITAVWITLGILWLSAVAALWRKDAWSNLRISRATVFASLILIIVLSAVLLDIRVNDKICVSWVAYDHCFRTAVIASLASNSSLPPVNYFFHPGRDIDLRYHYFSFLFGALMERMGGGVVSARMALNATILWFGLALLATISAFQVFFLKEQSRARYRAVGWALLAITGLDIIPIGLEALNRLLMHRDDIISVPTIDWWNSFGQVSSWLDTLLWVPNHAAGLIACLVGALILWDGNTRERPVRIASGIAAGLAFASATGLSIYVTIVFAIFFVGLALVLLFRRSAAVPSLVLAGLLSAVLVAPFLHEIAPPPGTNTSAMFSFSVRNFEPAETLLRDSYVRSHLAWNLLNFASLPLNYLFEFGFFLIVGIWWWRDRRGRSQPLSLQEKLMVGLLLVSVIPPSFIRSGSWLANDFQWRGILPAQFVLLLWATELVQRFLAGSPIQRRWKRFLILTAAIGFASTVLEIGLLRSYIALSDAGIAETQQRLADQHLGSRFYDLRNAYSWIHSNSAKDDVIQESPATWQAMALGLYAERRTSAFGEAYSPLAGGDYNEYRKTYASLKSLFKTGADWDRVQSICSANGIRYLVLQDTDEIWYDRHSYVWSVSPVFASPRVRVFQCR